jgi:hypothetical protein
MRPLALVLVLLAASPFTAPFSAHNTACELQGKDGSSAVKAVGDVALAPVPFAAVHAETAWRVEAHLATSRVERHQAASTVLRL